MRTSMRLRSSVPNWIPWMRNSIPQMRTTAAMGTAVPPPKGGRASNNRRPTIWNVTTEQAMAELPQIYLTQVDLDRLLKLVEDQPGKRYQKLEGELVRANVVPRDKIPEDVVTMNSRVIFE